MCFLNFHDGGFISGISQIFDGEIPFSLPHLLTFPSKVLSQEGQFGKRCQRVLNQLSNYMCASKLPSLIILTLQKVRWFLMELGSKPAGGRLR